MREYNQKVHTTREIFKTSMRPLYCCHLTVQASLVHSQWLPIHRATPITILGDVQTRGAGEKSMTDKRSYGAVVTLRRWNRSFCIFCFSRLISFSAITKVLVHWQVCKFIEFLVSWTHDELIIPIAINDFVLTLFRHKTPARPSCVLSHTCSIISQFPISPKGVDRRKYPLLFLIIPQKNHNING